MVKRLWLNLGNRRSTNFCFLRGVFFKLLQGLRSFELVETLQALGKPAGALVVVPRAVVSLFGRSVPLDLCVARNKLSVGMLGREVVEPVLSDGGKVQVEVVGIFLGVVLGGVGRVVDEVPKEELVPSLESVGDEVGPRSESRELVLFLDGSRGLSAIVEEYLADRRESALKSKSVLRETSRKTSSC